VPLLVLPHLPAPEGEEKKQEVTWESAPGSQDSVTAGRKIARQSKAQPQGAVWPGQRDGWQMLVSLWSCGALRSPGHKLSTAGGAPPSVAVLAR